MGEKRPAGPTSDTASTSQWALQSTPSFEKHTKAFAPGPELSYLMSMQDSVVSSLATQVPLFANIKPEQLKLLLTVFEEQTFKTGEVVFDAGTAPTHLKLLSEGELSVRDGEEEVFKVRPHAALGELSSLTGELRKLTVVASSPATVLAAPLPALEELLHKEGDLAVSFYGNLLKLTRRKISRDRRRVGEMRDNIVSTQKAMKRMREALLESEDSPLHAALFEELDSLIEQNRKIHYLVEPSRLVPTEARFEDLSVVPVTALSTDWLYVDSNPTNLKAEDEVSLTLILDGDELVISGKVERAEPTEVVIYLDELIPEFETRLNRHLARAQLLDVVL